MEKKEIIGHKRTLLYLAGPTRLELATSGVTGRRSNQTELRPRQGDYNYNSKTLSLQYF